LWLLGISWFDLHPNNFSIIASHSLLHRILYKKQCEPFVNGNEPRTLLVFGTPPPRAKMHTAVIPTGRIISVVLLESCDASKI
jgi:hypothetical protein